MSGGRARIARPYVDRGKPGTLRYLGGQLPLVNDPARVQVRMMKLQEVRRHNSLEPQLEETNRVLLRWGEGGGTGLQNPEAETRETHYDPLPPDLQEKVDTIVDDSPWRILTVKWYRSALDRQQLADQMFISRRTLYADWRCALWYYRGRFEVRGVHG